MKKIAFIILTVYLNFTYLNSFEIPNDPYLPAQIYLYNNDSDKHDLGFIEFYNFWLSEKSKILDHYKSFNKKPPIIAIIDTDYDLYDRDR